MNKAIIIGNLTKDPESRVTQSGLSVCSFTVAINRNFGEKKEVDYIPVVTWRGLADNCAKFLAKGRKVGVSGRIQTRSYDANDGTKRYVTEIVADDVEFLTPKNATDSATGGYHPPKDDGFSIPDEQHDGQPDGAGDFEPIDDEQMPF